MQRLLAIWCPGILEERELGREARAFGAVVAALEAFATRVDPVRPGVCAVPTRGPSRYFGGDEVLARMATEAVAGPGTSRRGAGRGTSRRGGGRRPVRRRPGRPGRTERAAPVIVPPGRTPSFLAPWPVASLDRPELADLLVRLGVRTLGGFAALPGPAVLARFGEEGASASGWPGGSRGSCPASGSSSPPPAPPSARARAPPW